MISVLFCDDHKIVREGLMRMVSSSSDFKKCEGVDGIESLLKALKISPPDVVVLDISMPGQSGMNALPRIRSQYLKLPILMMSMYPEDQYAARCARLGASGYINKDCQPEVLTNAIRTVASGRTYFSSDVIIELTNNSNSSTLPHMELSDREYEVMVMISQGKSLNDIANILILSPKTVSTYRTRIMDKMKASSNADLTRYALENELI